MCRNSFKVQTTKTATGEVINETFDYIAVATGHFSVPHDPHFDGEETFTGNATVIETKLRLFQREIYSCS